MARTLSEAAAFLENNPGEYLVFLDLDFGDGQPNGIDISFALKRGGSRVRTVFTTNHQELAMEVLKSGAEPFGFLEKGADMEQLSVNLLRYIRMALNTLESPRPGEDRPSVILSTGCGEQVRIDIPDILYLEAEKNLSHGITYHTVNGSQLNLPCALLCSSYATRTGWVAGTHPQKLPPVRISPASNPRYALGVGQFAATFRAAGTSQSTLYSAMSSILFLASRSARSTASSEEHRNAPAIMVSFDTFRLTSEIPSKSEYLSGSEFSRPERLFIGPMPMNSTLFSSCAARIRRYIPTASSG